MAGSDDFVGVAPDGSGKSILTRKITILLGDGTYQTVEIQAVTLVDDQGKRVPLTEVSSLLESVRDLLGEIRDILQLNRV